MEQIDYTQSIKNNAAAFYRECLWDDIGKDALTYIRNRGISDATIKKMMLGYAPKDSALKQHFEKHDVDPFLVNETGLLKSTKRNELLDYFSNYVIFPVIVDADVVTFTGRSLNNDIYHRKHLHLKGPELHLYNTNVLKHSNTVVLVESPFNALSLIDRDYPVVATLGANGFRKKYAGLFKNKRVYIIYDTDSNKSGQKAAIKTAKLLYREEKVDPYIILMPKDVDINEYFLTNTTDQFINQITNNKYLFSATKTFKKWVKELNKPKHKYTKDARIAAIPIIDVATLLGIDVIACGNTCKAICPFPEHKETQPSFTIYTATNSVTCFGCGFSGDSIALVRKVKGMGFSEAIAFLKKNFL